MKYNSTLESQINGSFSSRYLLELFRNSGYFAIVNILLESLAEGPVDYLKEPDIYAITCAVLIQAYWLTKWSLSENKNKFSGNLIGPAIYTFIEVAIEGFRFFQAPHHLAYWIFSILIGWMQYLCVNQRFEVIKTT
ncbi:MAG: hypothetical protein GY865_06600, partial [candidate division Zixibacteria bacterium]|nr:hypothetical protein [candidate division Zixibacteria bacterium]